MAVPSRLLADVGSDSSNVHLKNQSQPNLRLGTEFRWKTFGVTIDSTVQELVLHERLAWDAHCSGSWISCLGV